MKDEASNKSDSRAAPSLLNGNAQYSMPIAVIGMSCRFPGGAETPEQLWDMISTGKSSWSSIPQSRFNASAFYHPNTEIHGTVSREWRTLLCKND